MPHNILFTGVSGYLGGTLLARFEAAKLSGYDRLFGLVRHTDQRQSVQKYGAEPLTFDVSDEKAVYEAITSSKINIVYFLIGNLQYSNQEYFLKALAAVKQQTGQDVHFIYTNGAKMFGTPAGAPTDRPLLDTDPKLYDIQKAQRSPHAPFNNAVGCTCKVVERGEELGVRAYPFAPCIVYGEGEGFGKKISIQTVGIVNAAKSAGRVYEIDCGPGRWPVCHVQDNTALYLQILRQILAGKPPGHGKNGYFLASPGSIKWHDLYVAMARSLKKRGVVEDDEVLPADDAALEKMAKGVGMPKELVYTAIAGDCTFTAKHGNEIEWTAQYSPGHIIETADTEIELILRETKH